MVVAVTTHAKTGCALGGTAVPRRDLGRVLFSAAAATQRSAIASSDCSEFATFRAARLLSPV